LTPDERFGIIIYISPFLSVAAISQASFPMQAPFSPNETIVATNRQTSCTVDEEAVILHLDKGVYYGLNPIGARIWELIREPKTVAEIRNIILEEYDVTPERCDADLQGLLAKLAENDLIEVRG
jgi:hypothetical protein